MPGAILDAHHHLWDPDVRDYPWMTGPAAALRRRFGPAELAAAVAPEVTATIVVQAVSALDETEELLAVDGLVAGVVGWVDVTAPDLADTLGRLLDGPGRLVGMRHQTHDEPDPDWLVRPDVLRGLAVLRDLGLPFDLLVRSREVPAAIELAKQLPGLQLVVDHAAKPAIANGEWQGWRDGLTTLAAFPQVSCKLSGLVTEADPGQSVDRYARAVVDIFGPDATMFGSDWPVCTLAAGYGDVLDVALRATDHLSDTDRTAVLAGTARRVYGLDTSPRRRPCT